MCGLKVLDLLLQIWMKKISGTSGSDKKPKDYHEGPAPDISMSQLRIGEQRICNPLLTCDYFLASIAIYLVIAGDNQPLFSDVNNNQAGSQSRQLYQTHAPQKHFNVCRQQKRLDMNQRLTMLTWIPASSLSVSFTNPRSATASFPV
jgi:hypothetical protein